MASVEQVDTMIEMMKIQQLQSQEQLEALMKLVSMKAGENEGDGRRGGSAVEKDERDKKLNPKAFCGIDKLDGRGTWDQWSWAMKYRLKAEDKEFGKRIDKVETLSEKEMDDMEDELVGNSDETRSAELYGILSEKVSREAMTIVRSTKGGDGLMAWRKLFITFNPTTLTGTLVKIVEAIRPTKVSDVNKGYG